ncbi:MAG: radical SAM protein [Deltaproteobacteria bacterium]|nr:MAG: radical SAM protein [Deltaproteobacteria bacterium]
MKYLYGPVLSRRLGLSLGVNLVPRKVCTYNCIYCQLGRTTLRTLQRQQYLPIEEILREAEEVLQLHPQGLDFVSISGSGEPTLNSRIGELIRGLKDISPYPVAVITNGSLLFMDEVKEALLPADVVLPSLDAVNPAVFETINRPHPDLDIARITEGIRDFRRSFRGKLWLEVLFCRGINDNRDDILALKRAIDEIEPDLVHLNTVLRPGAEDYAYPVSEEKLRAIARQLGPKAVTLATKHEKRVISPLGPLKERVLKSLEVRPQTLEDLSHGLGIGEGELVQILEELSTEGKVTSRLFNQRIYYEALTNS